MKKAIRFIGRVVIGIAVLSLMAVAINDSDTLPFRYQLAATIILVLAALICLWRSNRRRSRKFYEPFNHH